MSSLQIEIQDNMIYVSGNTLPYRDELKGAGGRWDPNKRAWKYTLDLEGKVKKLVSSANAAPSRTMPARAPRSADSLSIEKRLSRIEKMLEKIMLALEIEDEVALDTQVAMAALDSGADCYSEKSNKPQRRLLLKKRE